MNWIKLVSAVACFLLIVDITTGNAQQTDKRSRRRTKIPTVDQLIQRFDANRDGILTRDEVNEPPFRNNFAKWDVDQSGSVTSEEIKSFREKMGISAGRSQDAEGTAGQEKDSEYLDVPGVDDLQRIGKGTRLSRQTRQNSAFVIKTKPDTIEGSGYVVLTDHTDHAYLNPLHRLAKHRNGRVIKTSDLSDLYRDAEAMKSIGNELRELDVQFLAIAPRMESYRENTFLGLLELMTTLDDDPQIDVYPGFLLASSAKQFSALIERSIAYEAKPSREVRPFGISQVPNQRELRSLQKSGILRKLFDSHGIEMPTVAVYSQAAGGAPILKGDAFWSYQSKRRGDFLTEFPAQASTRFQDSSLLIMHGHGIPGMSCGVDINAIPKQLAADVVLCGSCFSAVPKHSDFPSMQRAPGGYDVEPKDAFTLRAIDRGATVVFGHMRLSQGFPHLYPVLESWLEGRTVGEGYQQLLNALIEMRGFTSGDFVVEEQPTSGRQPAQNLLLYIVIGDPAIQPFEPLIRR